MEILFKFLNEQSGDRLFFYGLVVLISIYYIMQGLVYIFGGIFKNKL